MTRPAPVIDTDPEPGITAGLTTLLHALEQSLVVPIICAVLGAGVVGYALGARAEHEDAFISGANAGWNAAIECEYRGGELTATRCTK